VDIRSAHVECTVHATNAALITSQHHKHICFLLNYGSIMV